MKILLLLWVLIGIATPSFTYANTLLGCQCISINGMYVSLGHAQNGILGNTSKENKLLTFAEDNGFNYLIFYDLEGMSSNPQRQAQLASLITEAKTHYGIDQVAAALGAASSADEVINYNEGRATEAKIDVLNLEYEFWNRADRANAFQNTLDILAYFESVSSNGGLETEIYIGWITPEEGAALSSAVDRVLVHYYRQNDINILNYGLERLEYLAAGDSMLKIAPIFSNEGPTNTGDPTGYFMGPWLENHSIHQPFNSWMEEYQQLNEGWKSNLDVMGTTWFLYNYFDDIPNLGGNQMN